MVNENNSKYTSSLFIGWFAPIAATLISWNDETPPNRCCHFSFTNSRFQNVTSWTGNRELMKCEIFERNHKNREILKKNREIMNSCDITIPLQDFVISRFQEFTISSLKVHELTISWFHDFSSKFHGFTVSWILDFAISISWFRNFEIVKLKCHYRFFAQNWEHS